MRVRTYGEHTYSQAQLSAFAKIQTRYEDAWYLQVGVLMATSRQTAPR